jgi:Uncharacterised protein conserved in bacteria (DUF2313)
MALAEAYARTLRFLLPPGKLQRELDAFLAKLLLANAQELARVDQRGQDLITEADPRTTTELLPDFEKMLALSGDATLAERRARVVSVLLRRQRYRPVDFQQVLSPLLGVAPADVQVVEQSHADAMAQGDAREIYRFFVYRDPSLPGTWDVDAAQKMIDSMKPSHTNGALAESINFKCDDAHSLCDRDGLGV